jgi:hypothetical protein
LKFQCLSIIINNKTICECANRRVPCHANFQENTTNNDCEQESIIQQKRELKLLKTNNGKINLTNHLSLNRSFISSSRHINRHNPSLDRYYESSIIILVNMTCLSLNWLDE